MGRPDAFPHVQVLAYTRRALAALDGAPGSTRIASVNPASRHRAGRCRQSGHSRPDAAVLGQACWQAWPWVGWHPGPGCQEGSPHSLIRMAHWAQTIYANSTVYANTCFFFPESLGEGACVTSSQEKPWAASFPRRERDVLTQRAAGGSSASCGTPPGGAPGSLNVVSSGPHSIHLFPLLVLLWMLFLL